MATPEAPAAPRALPSSLAWAVIVPTACALGGWLAQYPYGLIVVGIVVGLAAAAAAAVTAGGFWHRPGAATIASLGGIALIFFAGPGLYQLYMATLGRSVPAVVAKVEDRHHRRGADLFCTVVEATGGHTVHEVSEQQNCDDRFTPGQRVALRADPLGLLKPRMPDQAGQTTVTTTLMISAGLFVLTGAAIAYAGLRRRPGHSSGGGAAP